MDDLNQKEQVLRDVLSDYGSLAIAFSGGVDSTYLAAIAQAVLGDKVVLLNARSPSFPEEEAQFVESFAAERGMRLLPIDTREVEQKQYGDNPPTRCYFCKTEMYGTLWKYARQEGLAVLADGANTDDLKDIRPGAKAAREQDVRHPLMEAGLGKQDIRSLSKKLNLPTWDKPAFACLASRIPYGERINKAKLERVGAAERVLREHDFRVFRVRSHENLARIEFGQDELERGFALRQTLSAALKAVGYTYVSMDLDGYRAGAMNEALRQEE